ncbi:MAG: flagellar biosynthesis protein FlhA [Hyphomicrobiales bacterium]|nr:flagellar biosynthesis protein FlhA [Hyphomicrobiales bacterium]
MSDTTAAGPVEAGEPQGPREPNALLSGLGDLANAARRGEIGLALGVIAILVVLILPMPAAALDMLLAISITFSVLILMTALFIHTPLEFSAFPTVLLIATMLRLALNLASTRLILTHGHEGTDAAGHVIQAFGNFVMQGNFVIGIIVFAILVIVNFVVITKGSGRIAEVAARFTLDAMPGKQMAIDADLSAGLISEDEARTRRKQLEDESSFFGAMDGASKFVRGDAIAGLLITFINIIGGMIVGVGQNDLSMADAGQTYTLLTIGDGLVSQVPALIVSTAAGLLVSKAGVDGAADKALVSQLSGYPKALGMSSFVMVVMAALPGIPVLPFLGLAAASGTMAWYAGRHQAQEAEAKIAKEAAAAEPVEPAEEPISQALQMDELRLELGYGLLPLINDPRGDSDKLTEQIKALRRQLASDMGFVMPAVRILDNMQLEPNAYVIKVKEVEAGTGTLMPDNLMVMNPTGGQIELPGMHTTEPTFGLPATWVESSLRDEAALRGYTVVDPVTVISTHLTEILKSHMSELLSYSEVQKLLDELSDRERKLLDDIVPTQISVTGIQRVLQTLLTERVSIRDLPTILEGIAEAAGFTQSIQTITEHVRTRLARQICSSFVSPDGFLPLITLTPQWEQEFAESIVGDGDDQQLAMVPSRLQAFIKAVRASFEEAAAQGQAPVLLTSPGIRPFVRSIVERFRSQTPVLSQNEIHPQAKLKTVAQV